MTELTAGSIQLRERECERERQMLEKERMNKFLRPGTRCYLGKKKKRGEEWREHGMIWRYNRKEEMMRRKWWENKGREK